MKEEFIETIMQQMLPYLDNVQMEKLKDTLHYCMHDVEIVTDSSKLPKPVETNESLLSKFLAAKRVEGCSVKTLNYYQSKYREAIFLYLLEDIRICCNI